MAVILEAERKIDKKRIVNAVWNSINQLFGECGASETGLSLIEYKEEEKLLILRCFHTSLDMVRAAIAFITKIGEMPVAMHIVAVSGTLKALRRNISKKIGGISSL